MNLYQKLKIIAVFLVIVYMSITAASAGTFTDLNQMINEATTTLILSEDYTYDSSIDSSFNNGIIINKDLTIEGNGKTIDARGQARIFMIPTGPEVTVKNITFKNGYTTEAGGAILCTGELTVKDCTFINNTAAAGGALFTTTLRLDIEDSAFKDNRASDAGGAVLTGEGVSITGSFFQNNTAPKGSIHLMNAVTNTNLLNYNMIIENGIAFYNNGTGTVNIDYNWWGDNDSPLPKVTGPVEINNYYTMRLASIDSPEYGEEYDFDYIFELNDNGDHDSDLLPEFIADIKYNTELVDSIDGRYNKTLSTSINTPGNNEIEVYLFNTSITSLSFEVKSDVGLNIEFSEENGTDRKSVV